MAIITPYATFLHIPKCGGTWVEHALEAAGLTHEVMPAWNRHAIAATEGRFVFTFVRHPLAWYSSFWSYRWSFAAQSGGPLEDRIREDAGRADEAIDACLVDQYGVPRSFPDFVEACVTCHPGFLADKYSRYVTVADFVGRQESLHDDLVLALDQAGAAFDAEAIRRTPRVNESGRDFPAVYTQEAADRLVEAETAVIEAFYQHA